MITGSTEDSSKDSGNGSLERTVIPMTAKEEVKPEVNLDSDVDSVEQTVKEMTVKKTPPPRPPLPVGRKQSSKCLLLLYHCFA